MSPTAQIDPLKEALSHAAAMDIIHLYYLLCMFCLLLIGTTMGENSQLSEGVGLQMNELKNESRRLSIESQVNVKKDFKEQEKEMQPDSGESESSKLPQTSGRTIVLLLGICLSVFLVALVHPSSSTHSHVHAHVTIG